ncbi:MAG: hypothetical protein RQ826_07205 [Xanthomonadales bacterium]|nr:hypothetical protein [Xanthomonadales bacterium]
MTYAFYSSQLAHSVTAEMRASWREAFELLSDPLKVGEWALGSWNSAAANTGCVYVGTSLLSGEQSWFRIEADRTQRLIDYHVGSESAQLPRISARIVPAEHYRGEPGRCLVTLTAWRDSQMDDERWRQLCTVHETEILLIKKLLEVGLRDSATGAASDD